jgi:two-component system, NarL family, invasion response regulator UvrY
MPAVLIIDDHVVVRQGLRHILAEEIPDVEIGEAGDAPQALEALGRRHWDAAILDISIPGRSGLELLGDLRRQSPGTAVLVLSMYPERHYAVRALKAGAAGYVTKDRPRDEFVQALQRVLGGGRYVSPTLAEELLLDLRNESRKVSHELLSNREYAVLRGLAAGQRVSDIAGTLDVSVKTVSTYRCRLLEKLRLKTTAELIRYAVDNGIADPAAR